MEFPKQIENRNFRKSTCSTSGYFSKASMNKWMPEKMWFSHTHTHTHTHTTSHAPVIYTHMYIYHRWTISHKNECSLTICDKMDGPTGYYAQLNIRKRQTMWYHLYVETNKTSEQT